MEVLATCIVRIKEGKNPHSHQLPLSENFSMTNMKLWLSVAAQNTKSYGISIIIDDARFKKKKKGYIL